MEGDRRKSEEFFGISFEDFERQRDRRYGTANPDPMDVPLWQVMIKHMVKPYFMKIGYDVDPSPEVPRPTWSFDRLGMSRTELPDGRTVFIGGEYDAFYDPDFCIYNDVIVRDDDGNYKIYGYPKYDFPPTDFHTATYVEGLQIGSSSNNIIVIGGLGYPEDRIPGITNVFVLQVGNYGGTDYTMLPIETTGDNPGWIWDHQAILSPDGGSIIVVAGKVLDANDNTVPMDDVFRLDLTTLVWERVGHLPAKELFKPKIEDRQNIEMDVLRYAFGYQGTELTLTEKVMKQVMLQHEIEKGSSQYDEEMLAELKQMLDELEE
ncbi:MAG: hypothetical protein M3R13_07420 [Armatimonadota bacterium]|nr:hypothetical protein [Armatimonadota bacterium]